MSKNQAKIKPESPPIEVSKPKPPRRETVYYQSVQFAPDFTMSMGLSYNSQMGLVECSTEEKQTRYSVRWIVGSPVVHVQWMSNEKKLIEYDIAWTKLQGATRLAEGVNPAPPKL